MGSDGGILTFGTAALHGSTGSLELLRPIVGISGYRLVAVGRGDLLRHRVLRFDPWHRPEPGWLGATHSLNAPIVGTVPSVTRQGHFQVAPDGGVFAFGDATFAGSCPGIGGVCRIRRCRRPRSHGTRYRLVTDTCNVYAFGDAGYGSSGPRARPSLPRRRPSRPGPATTSSMRPDRCSPTGTRHTR